MPYVKEPQLAVYDSLEKAINSKKHFIYLKKNIHSNNVFPFDKICGIISDIGDKSTYSSGFPFELINMMDMSIYSPSISYSSDAGIVYFSPNGYDTAGHVFKVIKLFNFLSSTRITIYLSSKIYNQVAHFANENITFVCYENPKEIDISASLILTYGYCARAFIRQKIPTIILGPNGLGGWVTPENINYLIKENFMGRPGGSFNEIVPLEILVDEFVELKECKNISTLLEENKKELIKYLDKLPTLLAIDTHVEKLDALFLKLNNRHQRDSLKPYLASNAKIIDNAGNISVRRDVIGDVLFSIPKTEKEFVEDLSQGMTCLQLQKKYKMDSAEFWEIILCLWDRKAIVFK